MEGSDFSSAVYVSPTHAQWSPARTPTHDGSGPPRRDHLHLLLRMYPALDMPAAAFQLVNHAVGQCGVILASRPESNASIASLPQFEAVIASPHDPDWIQRRCSIPGIVDEVVFRPTSELIIESDDPLQEMLEADAKSKAAIPSGPNHGATDSVADGGATPAASGLTSAESWLRVEPSRVDACDESGRGIDYRQIDASSRVSPTLNGGFLRIPCGTVSRTRLSFQSLVLGELQKSVMKIRMVPVEHLFRRFPRIVRDVAQGLRIRKSPSKWGSKIPIWIRACSTPLRNRCAPGSQFGGSRDRNTGIAAEPPEKLREE